MLADRIHNSVLAELARVDRKVFQQLMQELDPHPLQRGAVLGTVRLQSEYAYFIDSGVVSLVAHTNNGSSVEVALVGREGVAGIADALGAHPLPYTLVVQLPGLAYRAPKALIRDHIMSCSTLHELLMNYSQRVMHQLAQSAVCNRFHTSVQRLARWLLLTAERAETTRFRADARDPGADGRGAAIGGQPGGVGAARQGRHRLPPRRAHHPQHGPPPEGGLRVLRRGVAGAARGGDAVDVAAPQGHAQALT